MKYFRFPVPHYICDSQMKPSLLWRHKNPVITTVLQKKKKTSGAVVYDRFYDEVPTQVSKRMPEMLAELRRFGMPEIDTQTDHRLDDLSRSKRHG